jgi:hypothetical protein
MEKGEILNLFLHKLKDLSSLYLPKAGEGRSGGILEASFQKNKSMAPIEEEIQGQWEERIDLHDDDYTIHPVRYAGGG